MAGIVTVTMSIVDDRLSIETVSSQSDATPEQSHRDIRHPLPDEEDLQRLGSVTKSIPKKLKIVECLRQQNASDFQRLENVI